MSESKERRRPRVDEIPSAELIEKNIREHLDLRLRFAQAVSAKKGIPLADALAEYTDAHARITGRFAEEGRISPAWSRLVEKLKSGEPATWLATMAAEYKNNQAERKDHTKDEFWPLRYDYIPSEHLIDLHFGSADLHRITHEPGFLSTERELEIRGKFKQMFMEIKREHSEAEVVGCRTWLFSRPEFVRLFPPSFAPGEPSLGKFKGGGRWGQFYDRSGMVNHDQRMKFIENIEKLDPKNLEAAFPSKTYEVIAPIQDFYKEYSI